MSRLAEGEETMMGELISNPGLSSNLSFEKTVEKGVTYRPEPAPQIQGLHQ